MEQKQIVWKDIFRTIMRRRNV